MTASCSLALVGDYSANVIAHQAIPVALQRVKIEMGVELDWRWIPTVALATGGQNLAQFSGVWITPGSPYANETGVLETIRFARETRRPLLGTCGGFQHQLLEFARNVARLSDAVHAETQPTGGSPVIAQLSCSLVEQSGHVRFVRDSVLERAYAMDSAEEGYHCRFGFNPTYRAALESAGLKFTAFDPAGEVRGAELSVATHPFFVGTLFQPERAALQNRTPPLVRAFVAAAVTFASATAHHRATAFVD
jgi:CTP synthase (UTP-ammonia lyase)